MSDAPPSAPGAPPEGRGRARTGGGGPDRPVHRTRISTAWVGVLGAALVLVLLLVFILQNLDSVRITFFTATGSFPLGAALLLAAVGGVLLAGVVASLRILQLRRRLRRRTDVPHQGPA